MTEPIPHWPGRLVRSLGDHEVFVRSAPVPETDAEPALFVHGLEGSSRNWTDLIDLLRTRLACEAMDLPGFGDSPPRPDGRYSIAALAQTVIALIQRKHEARSHLIGNSLGGAVCVKVAATRPDLIKTLTLISPALPDPRSAAGPDALPRRRACRGVGPRLIRQYQAPCRRNAGWPTSSPPATATPALFPQARFAAEVAELGRRDALELRRRRADRQRPRAHRRVPPQGPPLGLAGRGPGHRADAWSSTAATTGWSTPGWRAGPRIRSPTPGSWCCPAPATSRTWSIPALVADEIGILLGMPGGFRRLTQARAGEGNTQPVRY